RTALDIQIMAADKDPRARNAASLNALSCGVEQWIKIDKTAFEKNSPPADHGTLITNPPYDERLQVADVQDFYRSIGDGLKQQWAGWEAWLISSNRDALKHVGLRSSRRITLFNGALECSFQRFDLYEGSQESNSQAERIPTAATPD
ncbi:MAG TPA: class I SAM-dependent RNA methyltransferase, partial [Saprospiraceae bacterium]|nr:class I SAM-dependent RNA methyltransferase [Saprospiraceae bacterium]